MAQVIASLNCKITSKASIVRIRNKMVTVWRGNINYFRIMSLMFGARSVFSRYVCTVSEHVCLMINMYSEKSSSPNNVYRPKCANFRMNNYETLRESTKTLVLV